MSRSQKAILFDLSLPVINLHFLYLWSVAMTRPQLSEQNFPKSGRGPGLPDKLSVMCPGNGRRIARCQAARVEL